jgi:integrase
MSKSKLLTDRLVAQIKPTAIRQEIGDLKIVGLHLVVQPSGAKGWAVRYRFGGKPRKLTIDGRYPAIGLDTARKLAAEALDRVAHGIDPGLAQNNGDASVAHFVGLYRTRHVAGLRNGTAVYVNRELDRMTAAWSGRDLRSITKPDVVKLIDAAAARGPNAENCAWQVAKAFFRFCEGRLDDFRSPAATIKRPHKPTERDRVLTDAELVAIWKACPMNAAGRLTRMLMLSGARRDEMAGLLRTEIGADAIVIPAARTKTKVEHTIALTDLMRYVLRGVDGNGKHALTGTDFAVNKSGRTKEEIEVPGVKNWRFHDLRRTFATGMQKQGVPVQVIEKLLNHKMQGVMKVYQRHDYATERRDALEKWSAHIQKLVGPSLRVVA